MARGETYEEFVEKFKTKKTTDDCYTPPEIYEAVADWAAAEYGLDKDRFVRPFWPGGDYEAYDYKDGDVVVDNPPFSILKKIREFYRAHGIKFFLFCPALKFVARTEADKGQTQVCTQITLTYENGAKISVDFISNLQPGVVARTAPELYEKLLKIEKDSHSSMARRKVHYPRELVTAARIGRLSHYGVEFEVREEDVAERKNRMDGGTAIYGGGFLLVKRAAAKAMRAAKTAEAAKAAKIAEAATVCGLSERELELVNQARKSVM